MPRQKPAPPVLQAARALGVVDEVLAPLPGATGQTWAAGAYVLRVRPRRELERELEACAAAGAVLPVPRAIDLVHLEAVSAVLLERLPGRAAGNLGALPPGEGRRRGLACGRLHAALAEVVAPGGVPLATNLVTTTGADTPPEGDRLLHLDLHPFNVLVDDGGEVSGVVDWANASAGHPDLDRARSASIFTYDPAALARRANPTWAAFAAGWEQAGDFSDLAASALVWAYRYMLADLSHRYRKDELSPLRAALDKLTMS